jgi:uncharacterized protein with HEPN domain
VQPRDWKQRLEDILEAIARIERYTANLTFDEFAANEMAVDAVVRNFTIIGEAARNIPPHIEARYPQLPGREMRGIRNVVVHGYFAVSLPILWQTIHDDLPPLALALRAILAQEP